MNALILVGGLGTRIRDLFPDVPKALIPVAGRPFLEWQFRNLARQGYRRIHLAAGYKGEAIAGWAQRRPADGIQLSTSVEPEPLGTAGGLRFAADYVQSERLLVLNGDSIVPALNVSAMEHAHLQKADFELTLSVVEMPDAARYGTVRFGSDQVISEFREKNPFQHGAGWVNAGAYVVTQDVVESIPAGKPCSLEKEIFPELAARRRLQAFVTPGPLLDMGTPDGLAAADAWFAKNPA